MKLSERIGWWLVGAVVFCVAPFVHADPWDGQVTGAVLDLSNIDTHTFRAMTIANNRGVNMTHGEAQLLAELNGGSWTGYSITYTGSASPAAHNPGALGLLRAVRSSTEAEAISGGARSIWAQLDAIRLNTASGGGGGTGYDFSQIESYLANIDYNAGKMKDALDSQVVPLLTSIDTNTLDTKIAVSGLGTQFANWRGESHNWAWFVDRFEEFTEGGGTVGGSAPSFTALPKPENNFPAAAVKSKVSSKLGVAQLTPPATDETTPPTWHWTFNMPGGRVYDMNIGFAWIPSAVRTGIHVICIFATSLSSLWMVWKSLERKG